MKPSSSPPTTLAALGTPPATYQRLQAQLGQLGWIGQGSLVCRPLIRQSKGRPVKKGPYYLWTNKVKGKTVCVALSKAQYQVLGQAIANQRRARRILEQMQALTFQTILKSIPGVPKRK